MDTRSDAAQPEVALADGGLEAWLKVPPGCRPGVDELRALLAARGVVHGVDQEALERAAAAPPDGPLRIARGTPPVPGEDGRVELRSDLEPGHEGGPRVGDDGHIDYHDLRAFPSAKAGEELARRIPPGEGTAGQSVEGKALPAPRGREAQLLPGRNVEVSADGLALVAKVAGVAELDGKRLSVRPVLHLAAVDFATGNVDHAGTVIVAGDVLPGFTVRASEDLEVRGGVEGATLEAGRTVRVLGGIRHGAKVRAKVDLVAKFADSSSELHAGRNLVLADGAVQCSLVAGRRVVVGKTLVGGTARAGEAMALETVGAATEAPTRLEVQLDSVAELITLHRAEVAKLETEVAELNALLTNALAASHSQPGAAGLVQGLTAQKVQLTAQLARVREELAAMERLETSDRKPRIAVKGEVFPGVTVVLNGQIWRVTERLQAKTFTLEGGLVTH